MVYPDQCSMCIIKNIYSAILGLECSMNANYVKLVDSSVQGIHIFTEFLPTCSFS